MTVNKRVGNIEPLMSPEESVIRQYLPNNYEHHASMDHQYCTASLFDKIMTQCMMVTDNRLLLSSLTTKSNSTFVLI